MPTRAKSQKPSAQAAEAKSDSSNDNNTNPDTIPHCKTTEDSCKCNNQENCGEWVIESEELLHVEINGIFQVCKCRAMVNFYIRTIFNLAICNDALHITFVTLLGYFAIP